MAQPTLGVVYGGGNVATWQSALEGVLLAARPKHKVIVFSDGFTGLNEGRFYVVDSVEQIDPELPGTFAGSSRDKIDPEKAKYLKDRLLNSGFDLVGIIGCCGNDHLEQLYRAQIDLDIPVEGWPKTMDNDLSKTLFTFGYPTAAHGAKEVTKRAALAAYNYSRAHIVPFFGRATDWVIAVAALWGFADIVIGGELESDDPHTVYTRRIVEDNDTGKQEVVETVGYKLDFLIDRIREAMARNKEIYGKSFAVVTAAESGKIYGLADHVDKSDVDKHGNPKINPENLYLALRKALKAAKVPVSGEAHTYDQLRFSKATPIDAELSKQAGIEAAKALLAGAAGNCVVIDHMDGKFTFGLEPLPDVYKQRFLRPEGWMDYANLAVNPDFGPYYECILGPVGKREDYLYQRLRELKI